MTTSETCLNFTRIAFFWQLTLQAQIGTYSSHQRCSLRKGVLRNFTKIRGKHLRRSLFFNKAVGRFATLFKKRLWYRYFSVNFVKFLKTYFSPNTSWRLLPYICFSFCIIIPSFVRQFYNQKQSSGGVLQKAILTSFAKFTRKHLH